MKSEKNTITPKPYDFGKIASPLDAYYGLKKTLAPIQIEISKEINQRAFIFQKAAADGTKQRSQPCFRLHF